MITRRSLVSLAPAAALAQVNLGFKANTVGPRSECGIGALMPWADSLWAITYNSHTRTTGTGLGLYRIDENLKSELADVHNGTHANRYVHKASNQAIVGPYVIESGGRFKRLDQHLDERLTATMAHLTDPSGRVYLLTMEGKFYELDLSTNKSKLLTDLVKEFSIDKRPHFKGGYTGQGRVVVTNNGFYDYGEQQAGLFEWNGKTWRAISRKPHMDVAARENLGNVVFATGWDESSVLLWALIEGVWKRYRLPKASHAFQHAWQTEWMRIREVETEHYLMDIHGMFYELQPIAFERSIWGVKPICQHLRVIPDFCSFRGLLALGGNQSTPNADANAVVGQPQAGIWFGQTDDLWKWGKPAGWGGPWRRARVRRGEESDPFLMTGFDKKMLHLKSDSTAGFDIEVDFLGNGDWVQHAGAVDKSYIFPDGFAAHWIRLRSRADCTVSAEFFYS